MERLIQRLDRIEKNFDNIFIRNKEGKTVPLAELPAKEAAQWIFKWLRQVIPDDNC